MNNGLKIILVDHNTGRSAILRRALQDKGHEVISRVEKSNILFDTNELSHADVIIVNTDLPDEEIFANLTDINKNKPKPIIMFASQSGANMAGTAIKAGVNAYIVDGLAEQRVQPIIDVAIARFREFQALKDELDSTRNQLAERKTIDRAKGLLMVKKSISEDEAYRILRKMAMDKNRKIVDIAENVINVLEIL